MTRSIGFKVSGAEKKTPETAADALGLTQEQKTALMQSIAKGDAQFAAGEGIHSDEVFAWLRSWGSAKELPAPQRKARRI